MRSIDPAIASSLMASRRPARWLGHKSINVTYAIYGHLLPNADENAIAALDREFAAWSKKA